MVKKLLLSTTSLFVFAGMIFCGSGSAVAYDPSRQRHMQPSIEINLDVLNDIAEKPVYAHPEPAPFKAQAPEIRERPAVERPLQTAEEPAPVKHPHKKEKKKKIHKPLRKRVDTAPEVKVVADREVEERPAPASMQFPPLQKSAVKPQEKPASVRKPVPVIESLAPANTLPAPPPMQPVHRPAAPPSLPPLPEVGTALPAHKPAAPKIEQLPLPPPPQTAPAANIVSLPPMAEPLSLPAVPPVPPSLPPLPEAGAPPFLPAAPPILPSLPAHSNKIPSTMVAPATEMPPLPPLSMAAPPSSPSASALEPPSLPALSEHKPESVAQKPPTPPPSAHESISPLPEMRGMPTAITPAPPSLPPPLADAKKSGAPPSGKPEKTGSGAAGAKPDLQIPFNENETEVPLNITGRLEGISKWLAANPGARVSVVAYASGSETSSIYPKRVSLARGIAVRNYLISKNNLDVERITVKALGNKNESGPGNRVDLFIIK
jgi:outer membrane protein OmpA-like peptidoglycan-associated protein